jgi:hypothetical protein
MARFSPRADPQARGAALKNLRYFNVLSGIYKIRLIRSEHLFRHLDKDFRDD